ncbi:MAG: LytTR family DNA-binding domain-containing protein [Defluviitaleaceae bacterium]|nr:LytTR family DNA-binding domain-containing protein [Defluviitaleaceae bacterium]
MLRVFVCEDNPKHLAYITERIENYLTMEKLVMHVVCSTSSPHEVLRYLDSHDDVTGLYFLDVDLKCDMNGIQLAKEIRERDSRGFVVFITSDPKSHEMAFKHMVEPLEYITKDSLNMDARIGYCIRNAQHKVLLRNKALNNNFSFRLSKDSECEETGVKYFKNDILCIPFPKIIYFESSPNAKHNVALYTDTSRHEFRGSLTEIERDMDMGFARCHRSYIVNVNKIDRINPSELRVRLKNGDEIDTTAKYLKVLKEMLGLR